MNVSIVEGTSQEFNKYSDGINEQWLESVLDCNVEAKVALKDLIQIAQNYGKGIMRLRDWVSLHYEEKGMAIKWVAFSLELIAAIALMLLMLITCTDVIGRYLLDNSLEVATELT
jgi:hypothetical protein